MITWEVELHARVSGEEPADVYETLAAKLVEVAELRRSGSTRSLVPLESEQGIMQLAIDLTPVK